MSSESSSQKPPQQPQAQTSTTTENPVGVLGGSWVMIGAIGIKSYKGGAPTCASLCLSKTMYAFLRVYIARAIL